jgi:hypothetical protein
MAPSKLLMTCLREAIVHVFEVDTKLVGQGSASCNQGLFSKKDAEKKIGSVHIGVRRYILDPAPWRSRDIPPIQQFSSADFLILEIMGGILCPEWRMSLL